MTLAVLGKEKREVDTGDEYCFKYASVVLHSMPLRMILRTITTGQVVRGKPRIKALVSTMGKLAEIIYHCLKIGEAIPISEEIQDNDPLKLLFMARF